MSSDCGSSSVTCVLARTLMVCAVLAYLSFAAASSIAADDPMAFDPGPGCPARVQRVPHTEFVRSGKVVAAPPVIELRLQPGTRTHECIALANRTDHPVTATLHALDAEADPTSDEPLRFVARGAGAFGLARWLRVPVRRVLLMPGDDAIVPFDVVVPSTPPDGTSHGAVEVQLARAATATDPKARTSTLVTQVIVTVPRGLKRDLRISELDAPAYIRHGTDARYRFEVANFGNVLDHVRGTVVLRSSLTGRRAGTVKGDLGRVVRRGTRSFYLSWRAAPLIGLFEPTLTVERDQGPKRVRLRPVWVLPPPRYVLALGASLVVLGAALGLARRRRRRRRMARQFAPDNYDGDAGDGYEGEDIPW